MASSGERSWVIGQTVHVPKSSSSSTHTAGAQDQQHAVAPVLAVFNRLYSPWCEVALDSVDRSAGARRGCRSHGEKGAAAPSRNTRVNRLGWCYGRSVTERNEAALEVGPVVWRDLVAHAQRQGLLLVTGELALLEAAQAIASDDVPRVEAWLQAEALVRPSPEQLQAWDREPDKPFVATIVQPFALAKEAPASVDQPSPTGP